METIVRTETLVRRGYADSKETCFEQTMACQHLCPKFCIITLGRPHLKGTRHSKQSSPSTVLRNFPFCQLSKV